MLKKIDFLSNFRQIAKFSAVGCINVVLDFLFFSVSLMFLKLPVYQAQLFGVTIGLFSSYMLNHFFTFKSDKPLMSYELFKFVMLSLICIPASSILINYLDSSLEMHPWISKLIVTVSVGFLNYILSRFFVYKPLADYKFVRFIVKKIYVVSKLIRWNRKAQVAFISTFSIGVDLCMYVYLSYVGLDSYKSQPLCVVGGLVCCYLLTIFFLVYRVEHFVGFFCVSVFTVMLCSPIMYFFEMRLGLNALFAKIPATICTSLLVYYLCRFIVYRGVFEEDKKNADGSVDKPEE